MERRTLLASLPLVVLPGYSITRMQGGDDGTYEVTDLSVTSEVNPPSYVVVLERVASQVAEDESVVHVQNLSADSADIVKAVVERRRYEAADLSSEVESVTSKYDYVQWPESSRKGRYFGIAAVNVQLGTPNPLDFAVDVAERYVSIGDPTNIEFRISNRSSRPMAVYSGVIPPFGVLTADVESGSQRLVLWNDRYAENDGVSTDLGAVTGKTKQETSVVLEPGETRLEAYQIRLRDYLPFVRTSDAPSTRFTLAGTLRYSLGEVTADFGATYEVRFDID